MNSPRYRSMKDLIRKISEQLDKLEKSELSAGEIDGLTDDSRELYERLVVLRYKAWEKGLVSEEIVPSIDQNMETIPVPENPENKRAMEIEKEVELPPFRLNVSSVNNDNKQTSLLSEIEDKKTTAENIEEKFEEIQSRDKIDLPPVEEVKQQAVAEEKTISSLNEKLSQTTKTSLAEKLQRKPIADLKTAIGLNQKFLFMNDLFEGENAEFNAAIQKLNDFGNLIDAKNYLLTLGTKYNWDLESDSVVQFTELVERRYA